MWYAGHRTHRTSCSATGRPAGSGTWCPGGPGRRRGSGSAGADTPQRPPKRGGLGRRAVLAGGQGRLGRLWHVVRGPQRPWFCASPLNLGGGKSSRYRRCRVPWPGLCVCVRCGTQVKIVSPLFEGKPLLQRHRCVPGAVVRKGECRFESLPTRECRPWSASRHRLVNQALKAEIAALHAFSQVRAVHRPRPQWPRAALCG